MPRRRLIVVLLLVLLLLGLGGVVLARLWLGPRVAVERIVPQALTQTVVSTGRVASAEESQLGATVSARVYATPVAEGTQVAAGTPLLVLESEEVQAQLAQADANLQQAQATLSEARRQYVRQQGLWTQGFISRAALDAEDRKVRVAQGAQRAAQAAQAAARARLAQLEIRAPSDGRLIAREVEVGDVLTPGKAVLTFAAAGKTEIRLDVDERYLARLALGQRARVAADAWPDHAFDATLTRIAPQVDLTRGTLEVVLQPLTLPPFLTQNMTVSAEIVVARKAAALTVAAGALQGDGAVRQALRLRDGRVQAVPVRVGMVADGRAEVLAGLAAGDLVLLPGQDVRVGERARAEEGG